MRTHYPFNVKSAEPLYRANEQGYGGFYPVGKNRFWHGGIHFSDPARPVTALADGEIVAYRVTREPLTYEPPDGRGEPYSNNFVLLRHTLRLGEKTSTFYSLYMHLLPLGRYSPAQKAGAPPIFKRKEYFVAARNDGAGLRLRSAERKEQILCVIPKGAVVERLDDLELDMRWPVELQKSGFQSVAYQGLSGYAWLGGRSEPLGGARYRITTTEDRPAPEEMGLSVHEGPGQRSPVIGILPYGSRIPLRTQPKAGQQDFFPLEGEGYVHISPQTAEARDVISPLEYDDVVTLDPPVKVRAGEALGYCGPYRKNNPSLVHLEIFTGDEGLLKALRDEGRKRGNEHWSLFRTLTDDEFSADGLCDAKKLLAAIDTNRDGNIDVGEMRQALANPDYALELRRLVCCHPTEWSEGADGSKWQRLKTSPWNLDDTTYNATLAHIRNMQFWDKVKGLPDPQKVWHFHPVAFVEEMKAFLREPEWLIIARGEIGQKEISGRQHNPKIVEYHSTTNSGATSDEVPWCSSFVNWVMQRAGYKGTQSAWAKSWLKWGKRLSDPTFASIAVLDYGKRPDGTDRGGHVGFVVGKIGLNHVLLLGGNQSNQVKISKFSKKQIVAYVAPEDFDLSDYPLAEMKGSYNVIDFSGTR